MPGTRTGTPALPFTSLHLRTARTDLQPKGYPANPSSLGQHVRKRRLDFGLTQKSLARRLGVSPFTVLNWETGRRPPAVRHIPAIVAFLGAYPGEVETGTLAGRLRSRRVAEGLSQVALAEHLGLDPGTVRKVEQGGSPRNRRVRAALATWLRGTMDGEPPA